MIIQYLKMMEAIAAVVALIMKFAIHISAQRDRYWANGRRGFNRMAVQHQTKNILRNGLSTVANSMERTQKFLKLKKKTEFVFRMEPVIELVGIVVILRTVNDSRGVVAQQSVEVVNSIVMKDLKKYHESVIHTHVCHSIFYLIKKTLHRKYLLCSLFIR